MNFPLYIDASMLKDWDCHEFVRQRYLLNRQPVIPNIYYQFGTAIHKAVQSFWEGKTYEVAIADAYEITNAYPVALIKYNVYLSNKWMDMVKQLPDLVAAYYTAVKQDVSLIQQNANGSMLECVWVQPYYDDVILCGRIDRVMVGPELPDVKTASEIANYGVPWKQGYTRNAMMQMQFGLYDWYLQQIGLAPKRVYLEVLIKGYGKKPCRYEPIELPYVTTDAYRARFEQQLRWKVQDILYYFRHNTVPRPWPMAQSLCQTKYGECCYLPICLSGETPKNLELYTIRTEHLECRK